MISKFAEDVASWVGINTPTGKAHVSRQPTGTIPTRTAPSVGKESNKDVSDVVRTMQNLMSDLGTQLSMDSTAQSVASKFKSSAEYVKKQAAQFSRTAASVRYAAPGDGTWGPNTRTALIAVKNFVSSLKIPNVIISEGTAPSPVKTMKDEELIEAAKANINNLSRLFATLELSTNVAGATGADGMVVIDSIDPTLPPEGAERPFDTWGSRPVTTGDLASFYSFFEFIQGLKPNFDCVSLDKLVGGTKKPKKAYLDGGIQKLAKEILDNTIIRLGQDQTVEQKPAQAEQKLVSTNQTSGQRGHCLSVIDNIIDWFRDRANQMYLELYNAYEKALPSPRKDRKQDVAATMRDAQLGKFYVDQMQKISDAWDGVRDSVIDTLRDHGDSPVVTLKTLREATSQRGQVTGKAHRKRQEQEEANEETGHTVKSRIPPEGPLSEFISLSDLEGYSNSLDNVSKYSIDGRLPEIDLRQWRSGSWTMFAQSSVKGTTDAEKFRNFGLWASAIRDSLKEVYNYWADQKHNRSLLRNQYDWLNRWINRINSVLSVWHTEYAQPMDRARQGR